MNDDIRQLNAQQERADLQTVEVVAGRRPHRPDDKELYESTAAVFEMLAGRPGGFERDELAELLDQLTGPTSPVEALRRTRAVRRYLREAGWVTK